MAILLLVVGLILFVSLVIVHELGHFLVARRNGVDVEEFGIGFPPRVYKKKMPSGFLFTVNALPLGGFVKLKGEHDADKQPGSFGRASLGAKSRIMMAGVGMNLAVALILMTLVALIGLPSVFDNQFSVKSDAHIVQEVKNKGVILIDEVLADSPAAAIGLKKGDQLVSIAGRQIDSYEALTSTTSTYNGQPVTVVVKNGDTTREAQVTLRTAEQAKDQGYLGVRTESAEEGLQVLRYTWSAPVVAVGTTGQIMVLTVQGLGKAVAGLGSLMSGLVTGNRAARQAGQSAATEQVSGPIGIFFILKEGSKLGLSFMLFIVSIISLTLAIMNALPIPALDGGRLFVMLAFRASKRKLTRQTEERIHGTGFAVLMALFLLVTIVDVKRFF